MRVVPTRERLVMIKFIVKSLIGIVVVFCLIPAFAPFVIAAIWASIPLWFKVLSLACAIAFVRNRIRKSKHAKDKRVGYKGEYHEYYRPYI